ncbi:MAG: phosphoribosylformylglycinamidine cyclo-ligase [Deltaproteobacteria bacterium]|nr:phosphoribosylformylglycinamidine cyclo-ligase [Deltaproteobacteria bacterium]MCF8119608.1 phosphoribosylformylglycinamidine cyclo-ligase [Deltaproteobacteria bacterium]
MVQEQKSYSYADAGVDIEAGNRLVDMVRPIVKKTYRTGVMTDIGGFAGLFSLNLQNVQNPVLVSSTDGVGTKLKIAFMTQKHDTIGLDLVAMCVNDIVVQGATPLFMLDYISMGKLNVERARQIISGIATGCMEAKCSLIGGETAEMPGFYSEEEYDLAGFVVGLADNEELLDGSEIAVGNRLIGLGSSGLHSNGYSLVRKIFFEGLNMSTDDYVQDFGRTLGEELLEPTRIYTRAVTNLRRDFRIYGISHITGGGLIDNPPRILPKRCKAVIDRSTWTPDPIFQYIQKAGKIADREMLRTFNNGIGLLIVVGEDEAEEALLRLKAMGETAYMIGSIQERDEDEAQVQFTDPPR